MVSAKGSQYKGQRAGVRQVCLRAKNKEATVMHFEDRRRGHKPRNVGGQ